MVRGTCKSPNGSFDFARRQGQFWAKVRCEMHFLMGNCASFVGSLLPEVAVIAPALVVSKQPRPSRFGWHSPPWPSSLLLFALIGPRVAPRAEPRIYHALPVRQALKSTSE